MSQERPIRLHAGPWSLEFERGTGWVRCVRLDGLEVVRAVYAVVRGDDWTTYSQRVVHSRVSQEDGQFEAAWRIEVDDLAYSWEGRVSSNGTSLEIEWVGESDQTFETRRTGLCVLHPQELKGLPCEVQHSEGAVEHGQFPFLVEPHQPFFDIRTISHEVGSRKLHLEFSGEVFEMEDQRNWTDASFKTYCRPQEWAQPYSILAGERLRHGLKMSFEGTGDAWEPTCRTLIQPSETTVVLPRIGTLAKSTQPGFDFVLDPDDLSAWSTIGLGNICALYGSFAELNRNRPVMSDFDGVAFAATPQAHAADERSTMENALGLAGPVLTAKEFTGDKAVCVGPISLRADPFVGDGRQEREIGPVWFLASLICLAQAGADAACFLHSNDFRGRLKEALGLVTGQKEIVVYDSENPYRAVAFRAGDREVVLNMRPYATSIHLGTDLELEPYEIRSI